MHEACTKRLNEYQRRYTSEGMKHYLSNLGRIIFLNNFFEHTYTHNECRRNSSLNARIPILQFSRNSNQEKRKLVTVIAPGETLLVSLFENRKVQRNP